MARVLCSAIGAGTDTHSCARPHRRGRTTKPLMSSIHWTTSTRLPLSRRARSTRFASARSIRPSLRHALGVYDPHRRHGRTTLPLADTLPKSTLDTVRHPVVAPGVESTSHGLPRQKLMRQCPPGGARPRPTPNRVEPLAGLVLRLLQARHPDRFGEQLYDKGPLCVRRVGRIASSCRLDPAWRVRTISVGRPVLL